ncbi:MAG: Rrf2 family transcriptional regulator [Actinobacteria bacterium]|nr:Rrf2 family transcriptional regulator [Actinomycetota bacterium]
MKLSTRSRYGTRLVLELALKFESGPVFLKDICKAQNLSFKYLSQIIILLKTAGIVKAMRGAYGGYCLAKKPEEIKLSEIVGALEGTLNIIDCIKNPEACKKYSNCASRFYWEEINNNICKSLEEITVKNILEKHRALNLLQ